MLRDIVQPNAVINPDYPLSTVQMKDGRMLQGITASSDAQTVRIGEITSLIIAEFTRRQAMTASLMPGWDGADSGARPDDLLDNAARGTLTTAHTLKTGIHDLGMSFNPASQVRLPACQASQLGPW